MALGRLPMHLGASAIGIANVDVRWSQAALTSCLSDQCGRIGSVDLLAERRELDQRERPAQRTRIHRQHLGAV